MQIELSDSGCLSLLLSNEELASLGVSFEELDYQNLKTRRLLHTLLRIARQRVGYQPLGALTVEALPLDGGCLLLVTPENAAPVTAVHTAPAVFSVPDANALLQIAAAWPHPTHPLGESSSLYRGSDGFWLIVYGGVTAPILSECATPVATGTSAVAFTAEHGTAVFIGDALPRLRQCTL